jgi:hypothetical protein
MKLTIDKKRWEQASADAANTKVDAILDLSEFQLMIEGAIMLALGDTNRLNYGSVIPIEFRKLLVMQASMYQAAFAAGYHYHKREIQQ